MKKFFALLALLFSLRVQSQDLLMEFNDVYPADVFAPTFNSGDLNVFHKYVCDNFDLSKITQSGTMIASFVIDTEGNLDKIKIVQSIDAISSMEYIRVLKTSPKWKSASRNGKPFSVTIRLPLEMNKSTKK